MKKAFYCDKCAEERGYVTGPHVYYRSKGKCCFCKEEAYLNSFGISEWVLNLKFDFQRLFLRSEEFLTEQSKTFVAPKSKFIIAGFEMSSSRLYNRKRDDLKAVVGLIFKHTCRNLTETQDKMEQLHHFTQRGYLFVAYDEKGRRIIMTGGCL